MCSWLSDCTLNYNNMSVQCNNVIVFTKLNTGLLYLKSTSLACFFLNVCTIHVKPLFTQVALHPPSMAVWSFLLHTLGGHFSHLLLFAVFLFTAVFLFIVVLFFIAVFCFTENYCPVSLLCIVCFTN